MMAKRTIYVKDVDSFQADIDVFMGKLLRNISEAPCCSIYDFLLPSDTSYYDKWCVGAAVQPHPDPIADWVKDHEQAYHAAGMVRPSWEALANFAKSIPIGAQGRWFISRPLREQEIAFFFSTTTKETTIERYIDVNESIKRITPMNGVVPCFTSNALTWLVVARRFMSGRERMAVQGLSKPEHLCLTPEPLQANMAGNAFSAPCVMAATVAALVA